MYHDSKLKQAMYCGKDNGNSVMLKANKIA